MNRAQAMSAELRVALFSPKGLSVDTAGLLTHDEAEQMKLRAGGAFSGSTNGISSLFSNTVVAAVPDSNRVPF